MARVVGDLWPQASGSASLGVEQSGLDGFSREIRPFNHIHMNSGVFHGSHGSSGVIRYDSGKFEISTNGGTRYLLQINANELDNAANFTGLGAGLKVPLGVLELVGNTSVHMVSPVGDLRLQSATSTDIFSYTSTSLFTVENFFQTVGASYNLSVPSGGITITNGVSQAVSIGMNAAGFLDVHADDTIVLECLRNITLDAGLSTNTVGQLQFQAWFASGVMNYQFGPHQSWYIKTSHSSTGGPFNNGFWPIAHSGNIIEMIAKGTSLQTAYNNGRTINTSAALGGPVGISGINTYGLRLAQLEGSHPHILMSGIYAQAASSAVLLPGAMWLQAHSAGIAAQLGSQTVTNQEEASAQSLGIPTLFYNTNGSGIVSVRVASGITQGFNVANSNAIDEVGLMIPINLLTTPSTFYTNDSVSGVGILVPGMYKITYTASAEKTTGTLAQSVQAEIRNQDKWGRVFRMLGSRSFANVRDSSALNRGTANGQWVGDLKQGDHIIVFCNTTEAPPAGNSVRIKSREGNIVLEWIGPRSAGENTLQKVS